MTDLMALLPHSKKDAKLDTKRDRGVVNEAADLKGCSSALFFEVRKRKDLYLWMSKVAGGPSVKMLVQAVHTTSELKVWCVAERERWWRGRRAARGRRG